MLVYERIIYTYRIFLYTHSSNFRLKFVLVSNFCVSKLRDDG